MLASIIDVAGPAFAIAVGVEALAVFVEQLGAARSPEEDEPRRRGAFTIVLAVAAIVTPGLLLMHGFLSTAQTPQHIRVAAMAAPVAAIIGGALLGAIASAFLRAAGPTMRKAAPVFSIAALVAAAIAALPSLGQLMEAAQSSGAIAMP
jgi:hypothetical protein